MENEFDEEQARPKTDEEEAKEKEEKATQLKDISEIEIKDGDYQILGKFDR